jgi:predicted ATP-grasp superfamily ATP-dependent carboligase
VKGPFRETIDVLTIGAVIMDADYRALAVVRSLGRHGIPVWVLGTQLCHHSQLKFVERGLMGSPLPRI